MIRAFYSSPKKSQGVPGLDDPRIGLEARVVLDEAREELGVVEDAGEVPALLAETLADGVDA